MNNEIENQEYEIISVRIRKDDFNGLEQGIAKEVLVEFLHWLRGIRKDMPETMRIAGKAVAVGFPTNRMNVTWHRGECRRPRKLNWNVTVELVDYQETDDAEPTNA